MLQERTTLLAEVGEQRHNGRLEPVYEFRHLTFQEYLAGLALVEGRYHQVRRMFERIGQEVLKLKRVRIAFLTDQGLTPGRFRHLTPAEVQRLKESVKGKV